MNGDEPLAGSATEKINLPNGILILGAAKSGTTGLFYAIQNALSVGYNVPVAGLFEPRHANDVKLYCRTSADRVHLVKMLLGVMDRGDFDFVNSFDKKIAIFRDPRDNVVSRIHFMLTKFINWREKEKVQQILQLFTEKEQKPDSVSILSILGAIERISGRDGLQENVRANSILPARFKRLHGDSFHMMPYDELVNGQFERLSEYLGFNVPNDFEVADRHSYVVRSKNSGAWRDWFLEEDVQFFARDVADDFRLLGFDPEAKPNANRQVDPDKTSAYVKAMFDRLEEKTQNKRTEKRNARSSGSRPSVEVENRGEPRAAAAVETPENNEARQARRARRRTRRAAAPDLESRAVAAVNTPENSEARQVKRARRKKRRDPTPGLEPRAPVAVGAPADEEARQVKRERRMKRRVAAPDVEARRLERRKAKRSKRVAGRRDGSRAGQTL